MKKIMVVSDTHKHHRNLARALEQAGTPDLLIHLGDAEGYEDYIADMAGCPLEIVSGNNDFFSMLDKEKEIRSENTRCCSHMGIITMSVRDWTHCAKKPIAVAWIL